MVCEICGKTMYWCLGHAPSVVLAHHADAVLSRVSGEEKP